MIKKTYLTVYDLDKTFPLFLESEDNFFDAKFSVLLIWVS